MKRLYKVMVFANFNVAAFTENGEQVPSAQDNLLTLWASLQAHDGYDMEGLEIETVSGRWRIFKTENGYNLERISI